MQPIASTLAGFYEQGFVCIEQAISRSELASVKANVEAMPVRLRAGAPPGVGVTWPRRRALSLRPLEPEQVLYADRMSPAIAELTSSPNLLAVMRELIGPDLAIHHTKVVMKSARTGGAVPWHQDWAYWRDTSPSPSQVNCLVYLDDATADNGCLEVVPGSHRRGLRAHRHTRHRVSAFSFDLERFEEPDAREIVSLPGAAGTAILFGPLLVHRSARNRTGRPRRSLTLAYTPGSIGDTEMRSVLRRETSELGDFFPLEQITQLVGDGPHLGQCAANYRRRELWKLAVSLLEPSTDPWLVVVGSDAESDALEWMAARKPAAARCFYVHPYQQPSGRREDLVVRNGPLRAALEGVVRTPGLGGRAALLYLDADTYHLARTALSTLCPLIGPGTVLLLDCHYARPDAENQGLAALREFAEERKLSLEYLGRADREVAIRVSTVGEAASVQVREASFVPTVAGISLQTGARGSAAADHVKPAPPPNPWWVSRWFGSGVDGLEQARRLLQPVRRVTNRLSPLGDFFPAFDIPRFRGDGPALAYCPTHSRRRELWLHALSFVADASLPWCEFGVADGESLDWLSLHKPEATTLHGFDTFEGIPEAWGAVGAGQWRCAEYVSRRPDLRIHKGRFDETLAQDDVRESLGRQVGLIHVDCDLYSSTRVVLEALHERIGPGTVFVFDEFCNYDSWREHEVRAFHEFVFERGVSFEYLSRADTQVALRVLAVGTKPSWSVRPFDWRPRTAGIYVEPVLPSRTRYAEPIDALRDRIRPRPTHPSS